MPDYKKEGNRYMKNQNFDSVTFYHHNPDSFQRKTLSLCLIVILTSILFMYLFAPKSTSGQIQEGIASEIIRFHVIANSDSTEDQELKLKVKDALTDALKPKLKNANNINEARTILQQSLSDLEIISNKIINENGFEYTASASLEHGYFPLKVYGDLSLPPGEYEAIRVELGLAEGQNWWCIMFPPLCFVDSTYSIVPESTKNQLKYLLTEEEYDAMIAKKDIPVKVKFKLFPWLNSLFNLDD
jgi:stage II sporulation protein R